MVLHLSGARQSVPTLGRRQFYTPALSNLDSIREMIRPDLLSPEDRSDGMASARVRGGLTNCPRSWF